MSTPIVMASQMVHAGRAARGTLRDRPLYGRSATHLSRPGPRRRAGSVPSHRPPVRAATAVTDATLEHLEHSESVAVSQTDKVSGCCLLF